MNLIEEYRAIMHRIEKLIISTDDNTPRTDKNLIELDMLIGLVENYEDIHFPFLNEESKV